MNASEFLVDGPSDAPWTLLLAHGAGQGSSAPFMQTIASGLAAAGLRVYRFNFPYMQQMQTTGKRRPPDRAPVLQSAFESAIDRLLAQGVTRERLVIGGKSMGGRIASLIADQQAITGLVVYGYPFHRPGKPENLRTEHLAMLRTPTLICQGERDPFGSREEVAGYTLSPAIRLYWLPDGEHSFKPRKASGHSEVGNLQQAVQATLDFVRTLGR